MVLLSTCYSQFAPPFILARTKLIKKSEIVIDLAKEKSNKQAIIFKNNSRRFESFWGAIKNKWNLNESGKFSGEEWIRG
jgi:restriction endonuclease